MAREVASRRRSAPRDPEQDYEQDETATEDEGEEDAPRSSRRSERSSRRSRGEGEERTSRRASRRGSGGSESAAEVAGASGWAGYKGERAKSSQFNAEDVLTVGDNSVVIKVLEDEPFFTYREHFINSRGKGKQKSFTCPGKDTCELHAIGEDGTRPIALINVADTEDGAQKYWKMGPASADALFELAEELADPEEYDPPLHLTDPDVYVRVKRTQNSNGYYAFKCTLVEADRLKTDPFTDEELDEFENHLFDKSVIKASTHAQLREVADEILDQE